MNILSNKTFSSSLVVVELLSRVQLFAIPWITACQAPLSMRFSRQRYWSELPCPPPRGLPNPGIETISIFYVSCIGRWVLCLWHHLGSPHVLWDIDVLNSGAMWEVQESKTQAESSLRIQQKAFLLLNYISYGVTIKIMPTWFMIVNVGKTNII